LMERSAHARGCSPVFRDSPYAPAACYLLGGTPAEIYPMRVQASPGRESNTVWRRDSLVTMNSAECRWSSIALPGWSLPPTVRMPFCCRPSSDSFRQPLVVPPECAENVQPCCCCLIMWSTKEFTLSFVITLRQTDHGPYLSLETGAADCGDCCGQIVVRQDTGTDLCKFRFLCQEARC
jgi:hypothetical protein